MVIIGLPSKGRIAKIIINILKNNNFNIVKMPVRQYLIKLNNIEIRFIPSEKIALELISNNLTFGLTGLDLMLEKLVNTKKIKLYKTFKLSKAYLTFLTPTCWPSFYSTNELSLLSLGENISISSKCQQIVRKFINASEMNWATIVSCKTTTELEPFIERADIAIDILSSGLTAKSNFLTSLTPILISTLSLFYNSESKLTLKEYSFIKSLCSILCNKNVNDIN